MALLGQNRSHKHQKLNNYTIATAQKSQKRPARLRLWWWVPIGAIVAAILAVSLGSFLGKKAQEVPSIHDTPSKNPDAPSLDLLETGAIHGVFVSLKGIMDNTAYEVRRQIPSSATAVSLRLFDEAGSPYYHSEVAEAFGQRHGDLTLARIFGACADAEVYTDVLFPSVALKNTDVHKQSVLNAYDASMAKELDDAGADEILMMASLLGEDTLSLLSSESFPQKLAELTAAIRQQAPTLHIGLMIAPSLLSDSDYTAETDALALCTDFLAVDLSSYTTAEALKDFLSEAAVPVLRHKIRLLLPQWDEAEKAKADELLASYRIDNYQTVG